LRVLIIRAGALGDTLMLMPAIANLRAKATIALAGRYPGIDYLSPYVNQCIDIESSGWHRLFMKGSKVSPQILPEPDHVVAFFSDPEGKIMENLKTWLPAASIHIFPVFPPEEKNIHIALYMARSIEDAGLPIDAQGSFKDSFKAPLMAGPDSLKRKDLFVLHPGSGSLDKNFPPSFWLTLITCLKKRYPKKKKRIVLLLGPSEEDFHGFFKEALDERDAELIFCPAKEDLVKLLSKASLYIGHDSGITHLAAMMGAPVIALFKKSSPEQWAPLGPAVKIMREDNVDRQLLNF
jgi:heptosyltransferase-3